MDWIFTDKTFFGESKMFTGIANLSKQMVNVENLMWPWYLMVFWCSLILHKIYISQTFLFLKLDFWSGKEEKESKANELMNWGIIILQWDCAS